MNFAEAARREATYTRTENGAFALNTTGNSCLDLFSTIGALRSADDLRVESLFAEAYKQDPLTATRILFYARDIREGLGERKVFRTLIKYLANNHPEALRPNLELIGFYGRFDDLYSLIGTPLENDMWKAMRAQFIRDLDALDDGKSVSLLGKWIKTPDASSKETRKLGILTAQKLGFTVYDFKRHLRRLRKAADIVERHMTANEWDQIDYSAVPSRAMHIYGKAFERHDADRFNEFINKAVKGEVKINSSTLFPYDLIEKITDRFNYRNPRQDNVVEAQWKALPNYVKEGTNVLIVADTSGSMSGRPMATSTGLAIYFAERNTGAFHNMWMSFSTDSKIQYLKGETLAQKLRNLDYSHWEGSTNLESAFQKILKIGIENHIAQEDMPKSIIVISDMEINTYSGGGWGRHNSWTFYDTMEKRFADAGYQIPNVVFWNVNSRHDIFHADSTRRGLQLCSGQSITVFKQLLESIGFNPVEMMEKTINSERYEAIRIEDV